MAAATTQTNIWGRMRWWWQGREWRTAIIWAPAVVATTGIACIAGMCLNTSSQEIEARYLTEGKSAFQAKNYARALTCYERLAPQITNRPEVLYQLALTAEAMGDQNRAATLMRELAPNDKKGYPQAHYWRAIQFLKLPPSGRPLAAAESHLLRALESEIDERGDVHGKLGSIYLSTGKLEEAEFHLTKAAAKSKNFKIPLAQVLSARKNVTRARQEAEEASKYFRDIVRSEQANIHARLKWAEAVAFLEDFPLAVEIHREGLASTNDEIFRLAIASTYVGWYDVKKSQPGSRPEQLIALIDQGLNYDPSNLDLLNRLIDQLRSGGAGADSGRKLLQELLAKGGNSIGLVHFALAVDAHIRGDAPGEKLHLERAIKLDPKTGRIANNLAWVLSQPPNPDLPRALALINMSLEQEPNSPKYLDTRGKILIAMGKWQEALADLELVSAKAPATSGLHAALAEIYEKLNQPALAAEHKAIEAESALKKKAP